MASLPFRSFNVFFLFFFFFFLTSQLGAFVCVCRLWRYTIFNGFARDPTQLHESCRKQQRSSARITG